MDQVDAEVAEPDGAGNARAGAAAAGAHAARSRAGSDASAGRNVEWRSGPRPVVRRTIRCNVDLPASSSLGATLGSRTKGEPVRGPDPLAGRGVQRATRGVDVRPGECRGVIRRR